VIWGVRVGFGLAIGALLLLAAQAALRQAARSGAVAERGQAGQGTVAVGQAATVQAASVQTSTSPFAQVAPPTATSQTLISRMARTTPTPLARGGQAGVGAPRISISDVGFTPAELRVQVGRSVTWKNEGQQSHDVSAAGGQVVGWGSGPIGPGGTFQRLFVELGRYDYICSLHPVMRGRIVVDP
jgi:plastocyanin